MGDAGDYWRDAGPALRQRSADKRAKNREQSARWLEREGIAFTSKNEGAHLMVESPEGVIDFWPGTGKFIRRSDHKKGRGVRNVIRLAKERTDELE